ncbi:hypothetical protein HPB50_003728 [Hyalomma asiaticum]|uniref:Uncharacterized protein n=1 Tax=Hyalomma asiaticum TaxID=266040 RepID=A0ACB7SC94_HYAAI|nr:hypothetical protein HPB50_003728 [Hyalomma asiaticum]
MKPGKLPRDRVSLQPPTQWPQVRSTAIFQAKYNIKRGHSNKSNHSSLMNQSDMRAKYRKKVRAVLQKNKLLAKALVEARTKITELESAGSRQQKIECLALPQIKLWLEANLQLAQTMVNNQSRAIKLLQDIMTPGRDFSLADISDMDLSDSQDRRQSLHPPGRQYCDELGNVTVIPEESESMIDRSNMIEIEPDVDPCSKVVDEEASILLKEVTGQEKTVVCAESIVLPPPEKAQGPSQSSHNTRRSGLVELNVADCPSSSSPSVLLERAFVESPTSTPQRRGNYPASAGMAMPTDLDATLKEEVPRRKSARKSCMSRPSDTKKTSRVTFVVNRAKECMAAGREVPHDLMPIAAESEGPQKAPYRAASVVSKSEEKVNVEHEGLGDVLPRATDAGVHAVECSNDMPEKKKESQSENIGSTTEKEASQEANQPSKQTSRASKKSRSKAREASTGETEFPQRNSELLKPEPMDVGATSSTDEDGAPRSSAGRPLRRNKQPKSYKEPSIHT